MEGRNKGLRSIFIMFWMVGSVFWVMVGALDGNFIRSVVTIIIGWIILFLYFWIKDDYMNKKWNKLRDD
jgi:Flp pilus assembly protein TadB